ncbi:UbiA-like polyprenyltransferase [Armatimonas rosea]|uniref:4-hydroxybenzoate polyprenyltransferase n=1 Tax=Armatimonas rosea TaxID=685828 RepID=A0A7W9SLY6_ARMRO|nr:UbiA-like polyprenyltransferase [Armatimonas rosea]MBB6049087.1 4-hydroxybenzoate polyprenyltransferase [Armatimonas rosea]
MGKLRIVLEMIKIEHTLFALPFALMGALLAARGLPDGRTLFWILVAMVGARSAAMAFNRLVDRDYDAKNPRTASRALPAGLVSVGFVKGFTALTSLLLVVAAWQLNPLALALSPVALGVVFLYSYTKRFTHWCHAFLGLALAVAPVGAWVAVRGDLTLVPLALGAAVVCWLVGFDTIYALQDAEFDRGAGLHSLPVRFGARTALAIGRASHALMIVLLLALGRLAGLHGWYFTGVALAAALIAAEHALISPTDLKRLNIAFFNVNIAVSSGLLLFTALDLWLSAG